MNFQKCVLHCFDDKELVREFNRLTGCSLGVDRRSVPERLVDQAYGHEPALDEREAKLLIGFVWDCIWLPLVAGANLASTDNMPAASVPCRTGRSAIPGHGRAKGAKGIRQTAPAGSR